MVFFLIKFSRKKFDQFFSIGVPRFYIKYNHRESQVFRQRTPSLFYRDER